jgi:HK97 family phage major capsid protein
MDSKTLNARKKEILNLQQELLTKATAEKGQFTAAEDEMFSNWTKELDSINTNLTRVAAVDKGLLEVAQPTNQIMVPEFKGATKKFANCTSEYATAFWNAFKSRDFRNAALAEGGTAADGSYLVPSQTDPSIPAMAVIEASARKLSRVITTSMDIKLPFQSAKTVATAKAESTNSGANAFGTAVPSFLTTTLSAFMAGNSIAVSWELMQDVAALSQFVTADLQRAVFNYEEGQFIGSASLGTGTGMPLGYLNGATVQTTAALTISTVLDLVAALKAAYYPGASFLINRGEFHRLYKAQIAASQFQQYITYDANGQARLLGFPVSFSSAMPMYIPAVVSPVVAAVPGAVLFGDFAAGWVIGDRGDSNIYVKVLDQVAALNGQTVVLGYRRTDQRCTLQESVQLLTTNA